MYSHVYIYIYACILCYNIYIYVYIYIYIHHIHSIYTHNDITIHMVCLKSWEQGDEITESQQIEDGTR